jgi:hypothetical protein
MAALHTVAVWSTGTSTARCMLCQQPVVGISVGGAWPRSRRGRWLWRRVARLVPLPVVFAGVCGCRWPTLEVVAQIRWRWGCTAQVSLLFPERTEEEG